MMVSVPVFAGPQEDYDAAFKAYILGDLVGSMPKFRRAADAGHIQAQVMLAEILDRSEFDEEAVTYYTKAADQKSADGQYGLGTMYLKGEGVKKDLATARRWITLAAEQGHGQAIEVLSLAYIGGQLGVTDQERESDAARGWIFKAAESNHLPSVDALASAYRLGGYGLTENAAEATRWQAKANELRGIRPSKAKRRNIEVKR